MDLNISFASRPCRGERVCGDQYSWWQFDKQIVLALADGLGHGEHAQFAAKSAIESIQKASSTDINVIFDHCHRHLKHTRGVAMAVIVVDIPRGMIELGMVGNVRVVLFTDGKDFRFAGSRGIVGDGSFDLKPEQVAISSGDVLALFSDGIDEFARLKEEIFRHKLFADELPYVLIDRWGREDDDASILLYQHN